MSRTRLTDVELQALLTECPEWALRGEELEREWRFADFAGAMEFVQGVAAMAEVANHHPDIDIRYNRVRLGLISHDAGGLTARDAKMARALSERFPASL
jgi:4a-hydroxytetrahydrobiopterin dehydratase